MSKHDPNVAHKRYDRYAVEKVVAANVNGPEIFALGKAEGQAEGRREAYARVVARGTEILQGMQYGMAHPMPGVRELARFINEIEGWEP